MSSHSIHLPKTVYFDTNAFVDVFEGRKPGLFESLKPHVDTGLAVLTGSDVLIEEIVEGADKPNFDKGITRFFSLKPRWVLAGAGLALRDLIIHYDRYFQTDPVGKLMSWDEFAPRVFEPPEIFQAIPDLRVPTPRALRHLFNPSLLKAVQPRYDTYMRDRQDGLFQRLRSETKESLFAWLVIRGLNNDPRGAAFAAELLPDPDRAPAFRLAFELECYDVRPVAGNQIKNEFLDRVHATLIPFVSLFVTGDGDLVKAIEWYDATVRVPAGKIPYRDKVCHGSAELEKRFNS